MQVLEPPPTLPLQIDARLAEQAVELSLFHNLGHPYWARREEIYSVPDPEERDRRFAELAQEAFEALSLREPIDKALAEHPILAEKLSRLLIVPARAQRDEGAELFVEPGVARNAVLRLRPETFLEPDKLLGILRHEVFHIADMLEPAFGYDPSPPQTASDKPSTQAVVVERYGALWDAVIDGRLASAGKAPAGARELRRRQFLRAFSSLLGTAAEEEFARWFEEPQPRHEAMVAFARGPQKPDAAVP